MSEQGSLFSSQWYRVADLRPQIRSNVETHRHYYRGKSWFVISARSSKTSLRVNAAAFYVISRFDGDRSIEKIWRDSLNVLNDDAPSQGEVLQLLSTLFDASLVDFQKQSDIDQIFDNHRRKQTQEHKARYWNPLFLRFRIFDPDVLAQRLLPFCKSLYTRVAFNAWLMLVLTSIVLAVYVWTDIAAAFDANLVAPQNLIILWLVYPLMKLLHELAHAIAVKRWGGEVHEFGFALLVLLPVPYVDASDSTRFGSKSRRMSVAAAGIVVEVTLACAALFVWVLVEPGIVQDVAFSVMLTGAFSSLLFNGNPLLKFDAYYVLSDAIEIPNLATRSSGYLIYLLKRYMLGLEVRSPVTADGERGWFVGYGIAAFIYRLTLTFGICLFVASQYFFIGVALAVWAVLMQLVLPIVKAAKFLLTDAQIAQRRFRANLTTLGAVSTLALVTFAVPFPHSTTVRGVVWPVEEAIIRSDADCIVETVISSNAQKVEANTELLRCDRTVLAAEVANLKAEQLAARAGVYATKDRVERGLKQSELDTATRTLEKAEAKLAGTVLRSMSRGELYIPNLENLSGSYFKQGDLVGYLLDPDNLSIRVMLSQERVALLGDRLNEVYLLLEHSPDVRSISQVKRRMPAATRRLVSPALSMEGGGELALDVSEGNTTRLAQPAFEVEVALPMELRNSRVGDAVRVRFDHGAASLAELIAREVQLLLLSQFNV